MWSTIADLATYCRFLLDGDDDVLSADVLQRWHLDARSPGTRHAGLAYAHGLGFQCFRGGSGTLVGHDAASMPGLLRPRRHDLREQHARAGLVQATGTWAVTAP